MATFSIFYSWQTDTPGNRKFILSAIEVAAKRLSLNAIVEDSPRVDADMERISGMPEVAMVLFKKIKRSAVFIGDMTLVGAVNATTTRDIKRLPNPNVLLEMGFAAGTIGWDRIIGVINEHFGTRRELPFDLKNRRFPIDYNLSPQASEAKQEKVANSLAKDIEVALAEALSNEYELANEALSRLDLGCIYLIQEYGKQNSFADRDPQGPERFSTASLSRLLDLGLLKTWMESGKHLYGYEWTYLGKKVHKLLISPSFETKVTEWSPNGLQLSDGRTVRLPGVAARASQPLDAEICAQLVSRGVDVDSQGRVYGYVRIDTWRDEHTIRDQIERVDISHILEYMQLNTENPVTSRRKQFSDLGWNIEDYNGFLSWQDAKKGRVDSVS